MIYVKIAGGIILIAIALALGAVLLVSVDEGIKNYKAKQMQKKMEILKDMLHDSVKTFNRFDDDVK